jgi:uncharacterized protein (DUF2141 family)
MQQLAILLILSFTPVYYSGHTCHITVKNLGNRSGTLYIGWYNKAEGFREMESTVYNERVSVNGKNAVTISFKNIPPGTYAISVFLDEDSNGILNTNFWGIPKELYGFSNNPAQAMRAATFEEAAFRVAGEKEIVINLK